MKLARTNPPLRVEDGEGASPDGVGIASGEMGLNFSCPNRESWISGLDTLLGGDPEKKGGDEDICVTDWSA